MAYICMTMNKSYIFSFQWYIVIKRNKVITEILLNCLFVDLMNIGRNTYLYFKNQINSDGEVALFSYRNNTPKYNIKQKRNICTQKGFFVFLFFVFVFCKTTEMQIWLCCIQITTYHFTSIQTCLNLLLSDSYFQHWKCSKWDR